MEKTIKIEIPEGYDDIVFDKETNSIKYIKKDNKPHSWEEFCENNPIMSNECYIQHNSNIAIVTCGTRDSKHDKNICISQEEAEAFLALIQLRQIRKAWVDDWKPDWSDTKSKYVIIVYKYNITISERYCESEYLSFPTEEMAEEFLECFRDLLEKAKILL